MIRGGLPLVVLALTSVASSAQGQSPASPAPSSPSSDPYHRPPLDTLDAGPYNGWQRFSLVCARCHGEDARGTSFGPDLLGAFAPGGAVPTREGFGALMATGRTEKGMPAAKTLGLAAGDFDDVYAYLAGRGAGRFHGGRPAHRRP